jgi:hypothetical protein
MSIISDSHKIIKIEICCKVNFSALGDTWELARTEAYLNLKHLCYKINGRMSCIITHLLMK